MFSSKTPLTLALAAVAAGVSSVQAADAPLMLPTLGVALFIRFIDGFRVFDNIWTLTGTGPGGSTTSLSIYIYVAFFRSGEIGQAIAASMILFAAAFLVLFVAARRGRGKETA